ncbi:hypothetical protein AcidC75_12550 [Acidisoma sp. C75]
MQLFTALDFDTGFELSEALTSVDPISNAGLEILDATPESPYVLKSPIYADLLGDLLGGDVIQLQAVIVPVRDLASAAQSRIRVTRDAVAQGGALDAEHPGGMWLTRREEEQEAKLAVQFFKIIHTLTQHELRPILLDFPRFAVDREYLWGQLGALLREHGVRRKEFEEACEKVVRVEKITGPVAL